MTGSGTSSLIWVWGGNSPDPKILSKAREIADGLGWRVECSLEGWTDDRLAREAISFGADVVHTISSHSPVDARLSARTLLTLLKERRPRILLFPDTVLASATAGYVSATIGATLFTDVRRISLDDPEDPVRVLKDHSPKIQVEWLVQVDPVVALLDSKALPEPFPDEGRTGRIMKEEAESDFEPISVMSTLPSKEDSYERLILLAGSELGIDNLHLMKELSQLRRCSIHAASEIRHAPAGPKAIPQPLPSRLRRGIYMLMGVREYAADLAALPEGTPAILVSKGNDEKPPRNLALHIVADPAELLKAWIDWLKPRAHLRSSPVRRSEQDASLSSSNSSP